MKWCLVCVLAVLAVAAYVAAPPAVSPAHATTVVDVPVMADVSLPSPPVPLAQDPALWLSSLKTGGCPGGSCPAPRTATPAPPKAAPAPAHTPQADRPPVRGPVRATVRAAIRPLGRIGLFIQERKPLRRTIGILFRWRR